MAAKLPLLLIIEDYPDVSTYIKFDLKGKYNFQIASNGRAGIDKAIELVPDIIIRDAKIPDENGFWICRKLKNNEHTSHIPIILLTKKTDFNSRLAGVRDGVDAYLSKPFSYKELIIRLEKLLELREKLKKWLAGKYYLPDETKPESHNYQLICKDLFLQKIHFFVVDNLANNLFGSKQLSEKMNMSESNLYRKIKTFTSQSTAIHIRSIRLQKAKESLMNSSLNVKEIAYKTGFNDPSYFTRSFSKEFGVTPSDFRM